MYTVSYAIDVNPPGVTPRLTLEQVWHGLVMKAENAVAVRTADGILRGARTLEGGLLREVVNSGKRFRERINLHADDRGAV